MNAVAKGFSVFFLAVVTPATIAWAQRPTAVYYDNGDVEVFDVVDLVRLRFDSPRRQLLGGGFGDWGLRLFPNTLAVINGQSPDFVEFGHLTGFSLEREMVGNILPPGLVVSDLTDFEFTYWRVDSPGVPRRGCLAFDSVGTCIPEPSSFALVSLGWSIIAARWRLRRCETRHCSLQFVFVYPRVLHVRRLDAPLRKKALTSSSFEL